MPRGWLDQQQVVTVQVRNHIKHPMNVHKKRRVVHATKSRLWYHRLKGGGGPRAIETYKTQALEKCVGLDTKKADNNLSISFRHTKHK